MIHSYLLNFVYGTPWAVMPEKLAIIVDVARRHAAGESLSPDEIRAAMEARSANGAGARQAGAIAVLNISGTIIPHGDALAESSGAMSCDRIAALFHAALADPTVAGIVLNVDSPGGASAGVPELADDIYRARGQKPVVAIANHLAASAAYWMATAADEVVCTPSGEVGSVGVYAAHTDMSAALEQEGIKMTLISAGKYKTEGNPFGPLSEETLAYAQSRVDECYGMFTSAVARNRGIGVAEVRGGFGQGRTVGAKDAVKQGMADRVDTLEGVLGRMARGMKTGGMLALSERLETFAGGSLHAGPISPHSSPGIASKDTAWDGPGEVAAADIGELGKMGAWHDDTVDPDTKTAYKLPHHRAGDHFLVPKGVHAAAGRLGSTDLPAADVAGVRKHLAKHYDELGEDPPWKSEHEFRQRRARAAEHW